MEPHHAGQARSRRSFQCAIACAVLGLTASQPHARAATSDNSAETKWRFFAGDFSAYSSNDQEHLAPLHTKLQFFSLSVRRSYRRPQAAVMWVR
jgi:hypothetical protein